MRDALMAGPNGNGTAWKVAAALWSIVTLGGFAWAASVGEASSENAGRIGTIERSITGIERDVAHNGEKLDRLLERGATRN